MVRFNHRMYYYRLFIDLATLNLTYLLSVLFIGSFRGVQFETDSLYIPLILNVVWYISARSMDLYDEFRSRDTWFEPIRVLKGALVQMIALTVLLFLFREMAASRYFVLSYGVLLAIMIITQKLLLQTILIELRKRGRNVRRMLVVGAKSTGMNFTEMLSQNPHFGYNVLGFVDDRPQPKLNGQYLGKLSDLEMILERHPVDDVVVTLPSTASHKIREVIKTCDNMLTRVKILPDYYPFLSNKFSVATFGKFPIITVRDIELDEVHWRSLKRGFDATFSLFVFIFVFSWLWPLIALGIKLTSPGPIYFKQERWGRNNQKMLCYKFRSMVPTCNEIDENGRYAQATKNDPRITRFGRFLRKTNLDELPQFWNVLKGEMSIVGPRPHPTPLNIESKEKVDHYMLRHLVKPGITGWAQVNGYRGSTKNPEQMKKRVEHDIWYIENWSLWLDIQIIFMTIWRMIRGDENAY
jgi:putative colanic acid biosysnthesis UDP-glucose lipid carrier transferase